MFRLATSLIFLLSYNFLLFSQQDTIEKLLITQIEFGQGTTNINPVKVEAAMNLVARLGQKYQIIPFDVRDSLALTFEKQGKEPTPIALGKELSARKLLLIKVNSFANILRTDIISFDLADSSVRFGKGYAQIRYFTKDKNTPILDPALLTGLQRAFADMLNEPDLYEHLEGNFKVRPAPPLVIGTINYIENDTLSKWEIFRKRQVTSYFAIETIFEFARHSSDFVVFDIPTRDSIYSYFNLYEPENYAPPNANEIQALLNFEVEFYISGEFFWDNGNAYLKLYLCKITEKGLEILKENSKIVKTDNLDDFKKSLELVTKELLNITKE